MVYSEDYFLTCLLICVLGFSAITDFRDQKILNNITLPVMLIALCWHFNLNGVAGLVFSASGLVTGIALLIIPYLMGGMGAGDAKLMGAVGAILGAKGVFGSFLFSAICGGIYALLLILVKREHFRGFFRKQFTTLKTFVLMGKYIPDPVDRSKPRLCYGIAIAIGTIIYMELVRAGFDLFA